MTKLKKKRYSSVLGKVIDTYDDIADELVQYKLLDLNEVKDINDVRQQLLDADTSKRKSGGRRRITEKFIGKIQETQTILTAIFLNTGVAKGGSEFGGVQFKTILKELRRSNKARIKDESKTAKIVKEINLKTFNQWRKNPAKMDLRGIDDKTHRFIVTYQEFKIQEYTSKNIKVNIYKETIPYVLRKDKRGNTYGFNILNGQRISKKIYAGN